MIWLDRICNQGATAIHIFDEHGRLITEDEARALIRAGGTLRRAGGDRVIVPPEEPALPNLPGPRRYVYRERLDCGLSCWTLVPSFMIAPPLLSQ